MVGAVSVAQHSWNSFFSFHSAPCGIWFFTCNILPLFLPDDPLQTCRVHLHKSVSVLDCVTPSTKEGLSHSKLATGIMKTKPRHLPAPLRRCFGFPAYPPQHMWVRAASIWRPQEGGCVRLPRHCLFLFDSFHLYKITEIFLASHQALIWSGDFPVRSSFPLRTLINNNCKGWLLPLTTWGCLGRCDCGLHQNMFQPHLGIGCLLSWPFSHSHPTIWL